MGLFDVDDFDDIEDIIDNSYERVDENTILVNEDEALALIGKILNINHGNQQNTEKMRMLASMLDDEFLAPFKKVQLKNGAGLQVKLSQISDKIIAQKKYAFLKNKAIVGIGGKFSAGKSKFINSILRAGEELLPEDQNPTTSIPTYIVYGEKESISAFTKDNEEIALNTDEMQALTHRFFEKYRMGFSSFIDSLIISEPDLPYRKLVFLDTPGYSKADDIGTSKTQKELSDQNKAYEQLHGVDYLIWLVDIENGVLSIPDIDFITKVKPSEPVLIVANKADKKDDDEIPDILKIIADSATAAGIDVFGVTAYSSRDNIEWGGASIIGRFLNEAMEKQSKKDDILVELENINEGITNELKKKSEKKSKERAELSRTIMKSYSIFEIKTLVNLYGGVMEEFRDIEYCMNKYQGTIMEIKEMLESY